jgi:hypothetical protein
LKKEEEKKGGTQKFKIQRQAKNKEEKDKMKELENIQDKTWKLHSFGKNEILSPHRNIYESFILNFDFSEEQKSLIFNLKDNKVNTFYFAFYKTWKSLHSFILMKLNLTR